MQKINQKGIDRRNTGFTLVETLVAIAILSISILATFTAVQGGLQASISAKDRITAFYLAQEGMELVRNIRDNNALNKISGGSNHWMTGMANQSFSPNGICYSFNCMIDTTTMAITQCGSTAGTWPPCPNLRKDPTSGLMGYNGAWTLTNFRRDITFGVPYSLDEVIVYITITWTTKGVTKSFQVSETLYNRQ
ncbi:MAG: hypothetical protein A3H52_01010 [Candidatus Zambryskibacteria bacterium RIFCSPLOWO2_02_FULL_39_26]|uniref:Type IV pilus modification protein PilV n=1 Tax=Candidatus Zambryskibacteria bacterium RIFCSPLOWO2_12_FULL_39_23 TaxID=1802776 RepID=A0A1G2URD6_9BACT|nr:MAG: hypothetical protein A3E59_02420 [Candidatus Zambryskibacteria bacterium RIFCSPHIGHO2_12_FULL_39_47]OHB09973.1 MAG: hypothetical protein A3H52_01010 [Candidatus Zambryskibacteria bacterium RIFCSPLOWO2_02_FULL_39_26]OHB11930.1 MAG: hypothetical protein A3G99_02600 [Candidatus Zambryskibacteria bacterium RIFCSPLOWO2_12_FULL_39_23]